VTVADFLRDWMASIESTVRPRTFASYQDIVRCHLIPTLGGIPLTKLQPAHVQRLDTAMLAKGLHPEKVRNAHFLLPRALDEVSHSAPESPPDARLAERSPQSAVLSAPDDLPWV